MKAIIERQEELWQEIVKFIETTKRKPKDKRTYGYFAGRLEGLQDLWKQYKENYGVVISKCSEDDKLDFAFLKENKYETQEELYYQYLGDLHDYCRSYLSTPLDVREVFPVTANPPKNPEEPSSVENSKLSQSNPPKEPEVSNGVKNHNLHSVSLPPITLQKFNGDYKAWISFRDLFVSLVGGNSSLTPVQKMHYLKTSLTGEAEVLLRSFSVTNDNYKPAWELLCKRYENKRVLVSTHLKALTSLSPQNVETTNGLKKLVDTTTESLESLKALGLKVENWDALIIHIIVQKLPQETHRAWEQTLSSSTNLPNLDQFLKFLESRFRVAEVVGATPVRYKGTNFEAASPSGKRAPTQTYHIVKHSCRLCNEPHTLRTCPKFLQMSPSSRMEFTKKRSLCFNCLAHSHSVKTCHSQENCRKCNKRHHTLLHLQALSTSNPASAPCEDGMQDPGPSSRINNFCTNFPRVNKEIVLSTAIVLIESPYGQSLPFRALLDPGSQASFMTENVVQRLRLRKIPIQARVTGLGQVETGKSRAQATFKLRSRINSNFILDQTAVVLRTLTGILPSQRLAIPQWISQQNLSLADPQFNIPQKVDILLGADVYPRLILEGTKKSPDGTLLLQNTVMGWVAIGSSSITLKSQCQPVISSFCNCVILNQELSKYWTLENIPQRPVMSPEEEECEKIFRETHSRRSDGRYVVSLPFTNFDNGPPALGSSKYSAIRRLLHVEKHFQHDPQFHNDYTEVMKEYIELNHMERIDPIQERHHPPTPQESSSLYMCYLPHHAVLKESSYTTKLRVVFDASSKTSSGQSLNDVLLKGQRLQPDIISIILQWRKYKVVFTADIQQMYRQIRVQPAHAEYQRVVWRRKENEPFADYRLLTVTFGTASAPFLAIRTLLQLAADEKNNYPLASLILSKETYVDDILSGGQDLKEVQKKRDQLINILKSAGFHLRKWSTNCPDTLHGIPPEHLHGGSNTSLNAVKALGISWDPKSDSFLFEINVTDICQPITKRKVLASIAKIFDPLGWISPLTVKGKIFLQQLWLTQFSWDDKLPDELARQWLEYYKSLTQTRSHRIPRWIHTQHDSSLELHGFCDASEKAYAAVIYSRTIDKDGKVQIFLLAAKTKVAPTKSISVPRLELCGALLLSQLLIVVSDAMQVAINRVRAWTDSEIVLAWLKGGAHRWKTFVANRVTTILESIPMQNWNHVSTKANPADQASRGVDISNFMSNRDWWYGPTWLYLSPQPPKSSEEVIISDTTCDAKIIKSFLSINENQVMIECLTRCSTLKKLLRATAYCFRFLHNCRASRNNRLSGPISSSEYEKAKIFWFKYIQERTYSKERTALSTKGHLSPKDPLLPLNPCIDSSGILRVGGRLANAETLAFDKRHPIILPARDRFTELLMEDIHASTKHGGVQLMLNVLRERYWVPRAQRYLKEIVHKCVVCFRFRSHNTSQLMGQLPRERISCARPFTNTGIDYAGPLLIRSSKYRGVKSYKGYIVIFICLSTKAIHIEAASDLSTDTFLASFRRFISRRGFCKRIFTDCGTNFVGAKAKLQEDLHKASAGWHKEAFKTFASEGIEWHFNPPSSPHFGGLWEAGVKSIKYHLRRVLGNSVVTYEELITVLCEIEACLNSRPLCPLTEDPSGLDILTPGHFLIGEALLAPPEANYSNVHFSYLKRWQKIQKIRQDFWSRWSREYLSRLQQRPKWLIPQANIQVGDLVLLKEDKLPPLKWVIGRITEVHPGKDNLVRVVTVQMKGSLLKRPISKICVLPIQDGTEDVCCKTANARQ